MSYNLSNMIKKRSDRTLNVTVLGGGSFGTVLANLVAQNGHNVIQWMRDKEQVDVINQTHYNRKYIPQLLLDPNLQATDNLAEALRGDGEDRLGDLVIMALPSKAFATVLNDMMPHIDNQYIVSATKGIAEDKFVLMSDLLQQALEQKGIDTKKHIGVLSGPNLAHEIAAKHITGSVIATANPALSAIVREAIGTKYLHIFENQDVYGVELAGALKNIYAIAAGISDSLGFGINTKSLLITRSIAEMVRFASYMQTSRLTFLGLASIGDLIATCSSPRSRNYRLGEQLVSGDAVEDICTRLGGVAEGIHTTKMTYLKAQELNISMPLVAGVYRIIFNQEKVKKVLWRELRNTPTADVEQVDIGNPATNRYN